MSKHQRTLQPAVVVDAVREVDVVPAVEREVDVVVLLAVPIHRSYKLLVCFQKVLVL